MHRCRNIFFMPNLCPCWISLCLLPMLPHNKWWRCPGPSSRLCSPSLPLHPDGDLHPPTHWPFKLMTQLNFLLGFHSRVYDSEGEGVHWSTDYLNSLHMQLDSNPNVCPRPSILPRSSPAIWNSLCLRGWIRHNENNEWDQVKNVVLRTWSCSSCTSLTTVVKSMDSTVRFDSQVMSP